MTLLAQELKVPGLSIGHQPVPTPCPTLLPGSSHLSPECSSELVVRTYYQNKPGSKQLGDHQEIDSE